MGLGKGPGACIFAIPLRCYYVRIVCTVLYRLVSVLWKRLVGLWLLSEVQYSQYSSYHLMILYSIVLPVEPIA